MWQNSHERGQPREYWTAIVGYLFRFTRSNRGGGVRARSGLASDR